MFLNTTRKRRPARKSESGFGLRLSLESLEDRSLLNIGPGIDVGEMQTAELNADVATAAEIGAAEAGASQATMSVEFSTSAVAASDASASVNGNVAIDTVAPVTSSSEIRVNGDMVVDASGNPVPAISIDANVDATKAANAVAGNMTLNAETGLARLNPAASDDSILDAAVVGTSVANASAIAGDSGSTDNVSLAEVGAANHLAIFLSPSTQLGKASTVTLLAQDAQNQSDTDYSGTMILVSSDTGATLPENVTFQNGRASFQATFATGGLQTITATDAANASLTGTVSTNVAVQNEATHLVANILSGVRLGQPVTVRLMAQDAENQRVSIYNGTVELTSSDPGASFPTEVTFHNGRAVFQATFDTSGAQTLTATDSLNSSLIGIASTNVAAQATATHFNVSIGGGVETGSPNAVRLVALDAQNRLDSNFSGTVTVTSSDPSATLPSTVTFHNGRARFQATFATQGPQTLTVTDMANASLTSTTNVSVDTAHLTVSIPARTKVGVPTTVRLVALDADNHRISDFSGTVHLTSSDGSATLPASVAFRNGMARAQVTFQTAGQQTLTATDAANVANVGVASTNVAAQATATHFVVSVTPGAEIGSSTTVRVSVADAQNRIVRNFSGTVDLTSSDGAAQLPSSLTFRNGRATFDAIFATPGSQTLTVTDSSDASISGIASTNVATQAIATHFAIMTSPGVQLGVPSTVRIKALDAQNQLVRNFTSAVTLTSSDASAVLPANVTFTNGMAVFPVTYGTEGQQSLTISDSIDSSITGSSPVFVAA